MTPNTEVIVFGVGGHGRECAGVVRAMEAAGAAVRLMGFVDDGPTDADLERIARLGAPFLGRLEDLVAADGRPSVTLGIGSGAVRQRLAERLDGLALSSPVLVHPDATVGLDVTLGAGSVLFAGARLTTNIRLARHVHINQNATVGHDSWLDDFVTVLPAAAVSGDVRVEVTSTIGAGAVVLQGLTVGPGVTVGASACVVKDVPADVVVKGVPAA